MRPTPSFVPHPRRHRDFLAAALATVLLALLTACGGGDTAKTDTATEQPPPPPPTPKAKPIVLKDADKTPRVTIQKMDDSLRITLAGETDRVLRGHARKGGKRIYKVQGGDKLFEARPTKDGNLKLVDAAGETLYRVRFDTPKIHIRNADKSLKLTLKSDGDKIHLRSGDAYLGRLKHHAERGLATVRTKDNEVVYKANSAKPSAMFPLILAEDLPLDARTVLMAEILIREL